MHHRLRFASYALIVLILSACGGLGGEPRIITTLIPPTPAPTEIGFPIEPPNLVSGAAIYAENCIRCHGITGAGDGELVQSGQVTNVASFLDPATMISQRPSEWHNTITNGRLDLLMPPWKDELTEQQRWDVAYYTYTLHYTRAEIDRGASLFIDNCADCHGDDGLGDGVRAEELGGEVRNLQDQAAISTLSDAVLVTTITEGIGDGMPGFAEDLTQDQIQDVAKYARTLALRGLEVFNAPAAQVTAEPPAPISTADSDSASTGTITGRVTQGSAGGSAPPAGAPITLFVFLPNQTPQQLTATAGEDGEFRFEGVPFDSQGQYVTTTLYRDRIFTSTLITPEPGAGALDLPITIYELTEDPAVIEIAGMVTQVSLIGDSLEVVQVFNVRNTSDRAFSTGQIASNGQPISLVLSLPPGALVIGNDDNSRYVIIADQYLLIDTAPVVPGEEHIVQVVYAIPYTDSAIVEQRLNYAFNGVARLLVYPTDTSIQSVQYEPLGLQTLGQSSFQAYGGTLALQPGDVLRYDITGATRNSTSRTGNLVAPNIIPILIIAVVIGEVLLIAFLYLRHRQRRASPVPDEVRGRSGSAGNRNEIDSLIRQIAELDAARQKGDMTEESYHEQRNILKSRLAELMTKK